MRQSLHRLLALAYLDNLNNYNIVNHIDGVKTNNSLSNLEWCDNLHNQHHAIDMGLHSATKGKPNGCNKYDEDIVREACLLLEQGYRNIDVVRELDVTKSFVKDLRRGVTWKHIVKDYNIPIKRLEQHSPSKIEWVCYRLLEGVPHKVLAEETGLSLSTVYGLTYGTSYPKISKPIFGLD